MKHENTTGSSRPALTIKTLISGVALSALLGLSLNVQAQTCVVSNWDTATALTDANAGTQGGSNRRYGGPCGLRVDFDGTARYVTDTSPSAESQYITRFYAFLDNATTTQQIIFAADNGGADELQVWYNEPAVGDLTLRVFPGPVDLTVPAAQVGTGWHSIELKWESAASAEIIFAVDENADVVQTVDTSSVAGLTNFNLGNIDGITAGSVDFDDFDSRRISRPGRLLRGDANDDGVHNTTDLFVLEGERTGGAFAAGQPDCNEDGAINTSDLFCIEAIRTGVVAP